MLQQHMLDVPETLYLRNLIADYDRMCRLEGMTPQRRGQLFNDLIGNMLRWWGVQRVETNVIGVGEIDVAFELDGIRYLLEAKWERGPVNLDPFTKLSGRMKQRFAGVRGVVLSMSGYTADALNTVVRGQQLDILPLDRAHFEVMLAGLLSPAELFNAVIDRIAYRADVLVPVTELLVPAVRPELPTLAPGDDGNHDFPIIAEAAEDVKAKVILHSPQPWHSPVDGIAVSKDGNNLFLTTVDGVISMRPDTGMSGWAVPIPGARSHALPLADGGLLVLCGSAVLRWQNDEVQVVAGGFTGHSTLIYGPDDEAWVFDYKDKRMQTGRSVTLTRLGNNLGQEERLAVDFQAGIWNAVWLSERRFFLAGDGHFGVVDLAGTMGVPIDDRFISPHPGQVGAIRINEHTVLTVSRHGKVFGIQVETGETAQLAKFGRILRSCDLATADGDIAYVLGLIDSSQEGCYPTVVCLSK